MMSGGAPGGSPGRNPGREEAVCTNAINIGEVVSEVISHAAATSFIHMQMLETSHTSHSIRKVGSRRGAHADPFSTLGSLPVSRFSPVMDVRLSSDAAAFFRRLAVPPPHSHIALLVAQLGDRARDGGARFTLRARLHPLGGRRCREPALRVAAAPRALAGEPPPPEDD